MKACAGTVADQGGGHVVACHLVAAQDSLGQISAR
jgi:hypothetical protein